MQALLLRCFSPSTLPPTTTPAGPAAAFKWIPQDLRILAGNTLGIAWGTFLSLSCVNSTPAASACPAAAAALAVAAAQASAGSE